MISRKAFEEEVENLLGTISNAKGVIKKLERAYELTFNLQKADRHEAHSLVSEILEYLFKDKFSSSYSIPIEFIESNLGKILFSLKFGLTDAVYSTAEITIIVDKTRSLISYDKKHNNLKAEKKGRNIMVYERDLLDYIESKGFSKNEAKSRLEKYLRLKNSGLSEEEIRKQLKK